MMVTSGAMFSPRKKACIYIYTYIYIYLQFTRNIEYKKKQIMTSACLTVRGTFGSSSTEVRGDRTSPAESTYRT